MTPPPHVYIRVELNLAITGFWYAFWLIIFEELTVAFLYATFAAIQVSTSGLSGNRQTDRHTNRQIYRQTDRQTDRQTKCAGNHVDYAS